MCLWPVWESISCVHQEITAHFQACFGQAKPQIYWSMLQTAEVWPALQFAVSMDEYCAGSQQKLAAQASLVMRRSRPSRSLRHADKTLGLITKQVTVSKYEGTREAPPWTHHRPALALPGGLITQHAAISARCGRCVFTTRVASKKAQAWAFLGLRGRLRADEMGLPGVAVPKCSRAGLRAC